MNKFISSLTRGLAAGAAGSSVLNTVTYLDMALTGRAASDAPAQTVGAAADLAHLDLSTAGHRGEAYGALAGLGVAAGVAAVASTVRTAGVRLPFLAESAVIGVGAMAATDGPMAVLGVTDMRTWTAADWLRDLAPHVAYGATVAGTLRALEPDDEPKDNDEGPDRPGSLLLRSLAIGLAAGSRSSLGLVPPAVAVGSVPVMAASAGLAGTELIMDKLPSTPSRVGGPTVFRVASAATGAAALARSEGVPGVLPAMAAASVGAVSGTIAGSVWRESSLAQRWPWQGALLEDVLSLTLTVFAFRR